MEQVELHVFTVDQNAHNFEITGAQAIACLLDLLSPERIFCEPLLSFQSDSCTAVFRTSAITRIDLLSEEPPPWPLHFGLAEASQVTEEKFIEELGRAHSAERRDHCVDRAVALVELALVNRRRIYVRLETLNAAWNEAGAETMMQRMLEAPSYHFRRHERGVIILNAANVIHADFHPGLPNVPKACRAEPMLGGGSLVTAYAAVET